MSKIFDSMSRAGGEAAKIALPLIEDAAQAEENLAPEKGERPSELDAPYRPEASTPAKASNEAPAATTEETFDPSRSVRRIRLQLAQGAPLLPFDGVDPQSAEQYRIIRTKITRHPLDPQIIGVSSPGSGDGKTTSAINLSGALALKREERVLLIDGDFRRSSCTKILRLPPSAPGIANVLARECDLEDAMVRIEQFPNLFVLPAGKVPLNPSELLDSDVCLQLFRYLRGFFRYIVVDTPPIASVADYELLQAMCDGMVLIVRPDHTARAACAQAIETIPSEKFLGAVVNFAKDWFLAKSLGYYYSYYYTSES